jgi:6-phosphogluconate dehydrogenase
MQLGMIGLGRMGAGMAARLVRGGHEVWGFDADPKARARAAAQGVGGAGSLRELAGKLAAPRAVWLMVPSGKPVDATLAELLGVLAPGDVVVDGGNSYYKDTQRRAGMLGEAGLHLVDAGTSGGIHGEQDGYCLMVGGPEAVCRRLQPLFETLAPARDRGWGYVGLPGAGHFVKMVHNGIEYGVMQAYAEGFALLRHKAQYDLDLPQIAELWRSGSVIRSWILDLAAHALAADPALEQVLPRVADSGEGRWTVQEAVELGSPAPVLALALMQRFRSRDDESYADRLLAALRGEFGGHPVPRR